MKVKIIFLIFIVAVSCDDIAYGFDCHGPDCTPRQANHSASYAEGRWSADGNSWSGPKGTGGVASSQTPPAAREGKESLLGRLSQAVWQPISKMISVPKRLLWETQNVCAVDERFRAVRDDTFDPTTVDSAAWIDTEGQINFAYKANTAISSVSFGDSCPHNYDAKAENTAWTIVQGDSTEDQQVRYKKDYHTFVEDCGSFKREGDGCFSEIGSVVQNSSWVQVSMRLLTACCIKDTVPRKTSFLSQHSGDGNVMLEEYWRNNAKCIVVNREPAAGVMR